MDIKAGQELKQGQAVYIKDGLAYLINATSDAETGLKKAFKSLVNILKWRGAISNFNVEEINEILAEEELDKKLDDILESSFSIRNNPIELKDWELNKIKQCLLYCKHRLSEHRSSGIRYAIDLKTLNKILKKFI